MRKRFSATRRGFVGGLCATFAAPRFGACRADVPSGAPLARLGVLSDVHLETPERAGYFRKALQYYRDAGVDGVVIAGDIANLGRLEELELCARVWFETFPDDKAPDGRHVERLFVYGNHDVEAWWWHPRMKAMDEAWKRQNALGCGDLYARAWERCFHEAYRPIWQKTVKGMTFIGTHWENRKGYNPPIEPYMKEHGREIDPTLPFFYIQHPHPKDTVYGPNAWGHDNGQATRALSPFPNAVALSGHSHYSLTDERGVWQGAFTSIGTASLFDSSTEYTEAENGNRNRFDPREKDAERRRIMRSLPGVGRQGMLFDVYRDRLLIHRRCFLDDAPLGDDWDVPLPAAADAPFAFAQHAKRRQPPEFPPEAAVSAKVLASPPPCARNGFAEPCVHVTFSGARPVGKCRVFAYEVRVIGKDGDVLLSRQVLAPGFNRPQPKVEPPGECLFAQAELPKGVPLRFDVRAKECFGNASRSIRSDVVLLAPDRTSASSQLVCHHPIGANT